MKRIMYLSLLLVIPFLATAEHGRDRINGNWISPFHGKEIKVKVKRNEVRVKNLTRRGWVSFAPNRRGFFTDRNGNSIRIKNVHELTFRDNFSNERIRFIKKDRHYRNHVCDNRCAVGNDFFSNNGRHNNRYNIYSDHNTYNGHYSSVNRRGKNDEWNRNSNKRSVGQRLEGKYYVREIDEYIILEDTRNGLRAKRSNGKWVNYRQNNLRKNEFIDANGNKYQLRYDGSILWKNRTGSTSLNLTK